MKKDEEVNLRTFLLIFRSFQTTSGWFISYFRFFGGDLRGCFGGVWKCFGGSLGLISAENSKEFCFKKKIKINEGHFLRIFP